MNTDPIADLLTRIRNASSKHHEVTTAPYSKVKEEILKVMKKSNFISGYKVIKLSPQNKLEINLKRDKKVNLKRISSPGQRIYVNTEKIHKVKNGLGISIISTSKGIMTGYEARAKSVGGELLCEVY